MLAISFSVDAPVHKTRARFLDAGMSSTMHIWQRRRSNLEFIHDEGVQYRLRSTKCQNTTKLDAPDHPVDENMTKAILMYSASSTRAGGSEDSIIFGTKTDSEEEK